MKIVFRWGEESRVEGRVGMTLETSDARAHTQVLVDLGRKI